jgi:TolB-like protein/DNA-binding SARP family transcriptional activator/Flp pilus assembly protein TadD
MWQLTLFGGFSLEGARSLTGRAAQRKRQALLALLGSGPNPQISRDKVVALLWPESDGERARHLLASTLYDLRQVLGDDAILATGEDLRLNPGVVRSDVREFDAAIEGRDYEVAASLRTGPFLDGFHVTGVPDFEHWVDRERDRLEQRHSHAIEQLAKNSSASGDHSAAARWLGQLAAQQPYNSRIALLYMQALDRSGDTAGAIRYGRTHELLMQQEFGVGADEQITSVLAEIRARPVRLESPPATRAPAHHEPGIRSGTVAPPASRHTAIRWVLAASAVAVLAVAFLLKGNTRESDRSIAVLPFKNMSGGEENAYFAEGIHEDVVTHLAKFPELKVISRTSVMQYRNAEINVRQIGRELDVAVVLEGSVRRAGNRIRVVAQLIDAQTDKHLWAETYDRELTDVFAIQSQIAQDIAQVLHADLQPHRKASGPGIPTRVTEAYDVYLQARSMMYSTPVASIDYPRAEQLLERAIQLDPQFASAYAQLTRLHAGMYWVQLDASDARAAAAATALAQAVRLRPDAADTHIAAGYYHYWVRRDYRRALAELEKAHDQLPGSGEVLHIIGVIERRTGDLASAIEFLSEAAQRDPARSLPFTYLGESLAALGRFEEANRAYRNALARTPTDAYTLRTYGEMYVKWRGSVDTLRAVAERMPASAQSMGGLRGLRFRIAMLDRDCAAAAAAFEGAPEVVGLQEQILPTASFLARAAECRGEHERARSNYHEAQRVIRKLMAQEGAHPALHMALGQSLVGVGRTDEGVAEARRALQLIPYERDALFGGGFNIQLAALYVQAQQHERALALLEEYCGKPFGIWPWELRLDPRWDSLRAQPRFQRLANSSCTS